MKILLKITGLCFLFIFMSSRILLAEQNVKVAQNPNINIVWSDNNGLSEQIYFSSYMNNNWTSPVQLSDGSNFVFHPISSSGDDRKIWVVWTKRDKNGNFLQFSVYNKSQWSPQKQINTGINDNRAVTIVVDKYNTPWIAMEGTGDSYSDIYWSRWNGYGWDHFIKAHADNKVPDVQPALSIDDLGNIILSWQTFADGMYVTVSHMWDGQQWKKISPESYETSKKKMTLSQKSLPELPKFIKTPEKATLFLKTQDGAESIPLSHL
ncbi:MAG: hypothetical protein PHZ02_03960 [Desulfocapsaceae bacterium]|nr:hypothetical protein [Desulfocapsaceae bacterium]